MDIRTKNKLGAAGFATLALAAITYLAATHWPDAWSFFPPRGTPLSKALSADLSGYDDAKLADFIKDLQFKGSSHDQRLALALKLKNAFDKMPVLQRLSLMLRMRKFFEEDPNSALVKNATSIMQDFWNHQIKDYMSATPEDRAKMLDDRIDEQIAMEKMEKLQDAAKSLIGIKSDKPANSSGGVDPMFRDIAKFRGILANAITDSFNNTPPSDRAAASQFFLDMRARRQQRGLPTSF